MYFKFKLYTLQMFQNKTRLDCQRTRSLLNPSMCNALPHQAEKSLFLISIQRLSRLKSSAMERIYYICGHKKLYSSTSYRVQKLVEILLEHFQQLESITYLLSFSFLLVHTYHKVAIFNTSRLETHTGFFRLLMRGIFDPYVL